MVEYAVEPGADALCPAAAPGTQRRPSSTACSPRLVERAGAEARLRDDDSARIWTVAGPSPGCGWGFGEVPELEVVDHFGMSPLHPYSGIHSLHHGGGLLFNAYTHSLAQSQYVMGGVARWATGRTERGVAEVPVGRPVHDFREWDPDRPGRSSCGGMARERRRPVRDGHHGAGTTEGGIPALFRVSASTSARVPKPSGHGSTGTLHLEGQPWSKPSPALHRRRHQMGRRRDPHCRRPIQSGWNRLVENLVGDVNGINDSDYPTFRDGIRREPAHRPGPRGSWSGGCPDWPISAYSIELGG